MNKRGIVHFTTQQIVIIILVIISFILLLYMTDKILAGTLKL